MNPLSVRVRQLFVCLAQPLVVAAWVITLLFLIIVVKRWCPLGVPGEGQWVWAYRSEVAPLSTFVLPLLVFTSLLAVWAYLWEQSEKKTLRQRWVVLGLFLLGTWGMRFSVQNVAPLPGQGASYVGWTVVSRVSTTYFAEALAIQEVVGFLRTFPERMRQSDWHGQTHPPGTVLLFYGVIRTLRQSPGLAHAARRLMGWDDEKVLREHREYIEGRTGVPLQDTDLVAAAAAGYLLPLIGGLGILPLWGLAQRLFDERTAWAAALLWWVVPSWNLFFPVVDQVYLTLALVAVWLLGEGLARPSGWFIAAAGTALAFGLFMTLAFLALLVLCVLWIGVVTFQHRRNMVKRLALFTGGLLLPLVMFSVLWGLNMMTVLQIALSAHGGVTERRIYSVWTVVNLLDFFVFLGLPVALFFAVCCVHNCKRWLRKTDSGEHVSTAGALLLSFVVMLVLLDLSGVVRGEVARIWMFLMPLPLLWAAATAAADERQGGLRVGIVGSAVLLQTLMLQREVWLVRPW